MANGPCNYFEQLLYFADYCDANLANTLQTKENNDIQFENLSSDSYLHSFRLEYRLDRFISDSEDETVCRILRWVFEILLHPDYIANTIDYSNSMDMIIKSKNNRVNLNCYCHAYILRDALQSVGITARMVYCLPINCDYYGNHVVIEYYSHFRKRWILIDPTYNILFADHRGELLNLIELRRRIINQDNVVIVNNNRFTAKNGYNEITYFDYLNMIMPVLIVLQYESINKHHVHYYRLISHKYLVPIQQISMDSISYIYDHERLYHAQ